MKKYIILSMILTAGIVSAGCQKNEEENVRNNFTDNTPQTEYVMQEGDTQITGEVTEIIGNEVTLALGDVSQNNSAQEVPDNEDIPDGEDFPAFGGGEGFPQMGDGEGFRQRGDGEGFPQMGDGEGFPQRGDGENFSQRGNGEGSPQMGGRGRGNRSAASIEKSGETASYIIPVGMTVTGASGRNNDYSAVSAGMVLQLTVNSDGYVVAAEIL